MTPNSVQLQIKLVLDARKATVALNKIHVCALTQATF